jgi:PIN domain nuclease of toxin-antitoxin system
MKVLLDTHVFLWAIERPALLSKKAAALIQDEDNELVLSTASLLEIALKVRTGKLRLPEDRHYFEEHMANLGVECLPIQAEHVLELLTLPDHHRDPFDRLLVAQCRTERLVLVTADKTIRRYDVKTLW